jgi:hypothetical protein
MRRAPLIVAKLVLAVAVLTVGLDDFLEQTLALAALGLGWLGFLPNAAVDKA